MRRIAEHFVAPLAVYLGITHAVLAAPRILELDWQNLIPASSRQVPALGIVQHGDPVVASYDPKEVVADLEGAVVRLTGFIVPLEFDGRLVTEFLLAPYAGACIHVPPPPPNQLVFVSVPKGFRLGNLVDAVAVTGTLHVSPMATDLAEVGYRITADRVEEHHF